MSKDELRRQARARLRAMPPVERARAGEEATRWVWSLPELADARVLLLFAALPAEMPTDAIAEDAWRRGITVVYPRCVPATREMTLHRVAGADQLLGGGSYGIREPAPACPRARLADIDAALIPGLAWDRAGRRLGRGAGYYDRLLSRPEWRGYRCGLLFAAQEFPAVPADPWDVPLQAVVTERGAVRMERTGKR